MAFVLIGAWARLCAGHDLGGAAPGRASSASCSARSVSPDAIWRLDRRPGRCGDAGRLVAGSAAQLPAGRIVPPVQHRLRSGRPNLYTTHGRRAARGQRAGAGALWRLWSSPGGASPTRRPASFRRRTRAICWSTCSLPDAASAERTRQVMRQHRGDRHEDPGRQAHRGHLRAIDPAQCQRPELRRHVRDARRLPRQARPKT